MSGELTYGTVPIPCPNCSTEGTQVYHSGPCHKYLAHARQEQVRCPLCGDLHECRMERPINLDGSPFLG